MNFEPSTGRLAMGYKPYFVFNDASRAASLSSNVTWGLEHLGIPRLWKAGLTGKDIRIAHLDTGIDAAHPAFKGGALADFAEFELSLGQRVTSSPAPHDSGDHGTHTAATIAGRPVAGKHIGAAHRALLHSGLVIEGGNVVARVLGGLDWAIGANVNMPPAAVNLTV